ASPSAIGSTPVAFGSSVPACPTLRVPAARRMRRTTSNEVMPCGLLMLMKPRSAAVSPRGRVALEVTALVPGDLAEQRGDAVALRDRAVHLEAQTRDSAHVQDLP